MSFPDVGEGHGNRDFDLDEVLDFEDEDDVLDNVSGSRGRARGAQRVSSGGDNESDDSDDEADAKAARYAPRVFNFTFAKHCRGR
jgi:hypothetical protein